MKTGNQLFDLERFIDAQDAVIRQVTHELEIGEKQTHWIWFVFPQLKGLGISSYSLKFGIVGIDEAKAYLAHPVLGPRLRKWVDIVMKHHDKTALDVFGKIDAMKFCSCLTLFHLAAPEDELFSAALSQFFCSQLDKKTVSALAAKPSPTAKTAK